MTSPSVLFISHEATRTGAPLVLLRLIRWLRANTELRMKLVLIKGGALTPEFAEVVPTVTVEGPLGYSLRRAQDLLARYADPEGGPATALGRCSVAALRAAHLRSRLPALKHHDLIYANSAESAAVFDSLPKARPPILSHVHELGFALDHLLPIGARDALLRHTAHYLACADVVGDALQERGVERSNISVCPEFIDRATVASGDRATARASVRRELGLDDDAFLVGGSGTRDWRKGIDLFVRLGDVLHTRLRAPIHLLWVGGSSAPKDAAKLAHDLDRLGLTGVVHLVPPTSDPDRYYRALDVFALTSREDPYPLVCLEAAAEGTPIVTFASGGAVEFARSGAGLEVPYADVEAMARAVLELHSDAQRRARLGDAARARAMDHDVQVLAPRVLDVIERTAHCT